MLHEMPYHPLFFDTPGPTRFQKLKHKFGGSKKKVMEYLGSKYTPEQLTKLKYDWNFFAREEQLIPAIWKRMQPMLTAQKTLKIDGKMRTINYPPEWDDSPKSRTPSGEYVPWSWKTLLWRCGRGFGKTKSGSEGCRQATHEYEMTEIAYLGKVTTPDVKETMAERGLVACSPEWELKRLMKDGEMYGWNRSDNSIRWLNEAVARAYTAQDGENLRGPQHQLCWIDEAASMKNFDAVWKQLQMMNRMKRPEKSWWWPR